MIDKLVIFDVDGTLYKTEQVSVEAVQRAMQEMGLKDLDKEVICSYFGDNAEVFCSKIAPNIDYNDRLKLLHKIDQYELALMADKGQLYEGIEQVLDSLKKDNYTLAICSYASQKYIKRFLEVFGLEHYFTYIKYYTNHESKSEILAELLDYADYSQAIMIGDRTHDIKAAHENGIPSIGVEYGYASHEAKEAEYVASEVADIYNIVQKHFSGLSDNKLSFNEDGKFKILQFTDVHYTSGQDCDLDTTKLMESILKLEKPDCVVFTGDTVYGNNNKVLISQAVKPVEDAKIPWLFVFGNHDTEWGANKEELFKEIIKNNYCLMQKGDNEISGLGNYCINIYSKETKPAWIIYCLDSGGMNSNIDIKGYDYIKRDQINWYIKQAKSIQEQYGSLPALCFFHIPIPEFNYVWDHCECIGDKFEEVCCPKQNSGFFSAMLEMKDVKGVFVGHDHINDYRGNMYGIELCYGRATGYNTYSKQGYKHGARVIELTEGCDEFRTWIRLEDGGIIG